MLLVSLSLAGCQSDNSSFGSSAVGQTQSPQTGIDGSATLSWDAPTTTTNGQALTDLSGYRIYYGSSEDTLSQTVQLSGVGVQTYVIDNLAQGTWYFAIKAITSAGIESPMSNVVSKTIS